MSDIEDFGMTGGFFADAGVDVEIISEDPYNFGRGYHVVSVKEWRAPKMSETGTGKYGSYIFFEVAEAKYEGLTFGRWIQLPTPKALQEASGVPFDPENNHKDMAAASNFMRFLAALGFTRDTLNQANPANCQNRQFLAVLGAREEDGRWNIGFGFASLKKMPEPGTEEFNALIPQIQGIEGAASRGGQNEFAPKKSSADAIAAAMAADMDKA